MNFSIFGRYKYIYENGEIVLKDLAEPTQKRDDYVYAVHKELAPTDQEPIGGIESEGEPILADFKDSATTLLQASEIIAADDMDIAEGLI